MTEPTATAQDAPTEELRSPLEVAMTLAENFPGYMASQSPILAEITKTLAARVRELEAELAAATAEPISPRFPRVVEMEAYDLSEADADQLSEIAEGERMEFVNGATGEKFDAKLVDAGGKAFTFIEDTSAVIVIRFKG